MKPPVGFVAVFVLATLVALASYRIKEYIFHEDREPATWIRPANEAETIGPSGATEPCPSNAQEIALDKLNIEGRTFNAFEVQLHEATKADLDGEAKMLQCLRVWADSLSEPCWRDAYAGWVDYYQEELNEAYQEYNSHAGEIEAGNYRSKEDREQSAIKSYERTHKVPTPPACDSGSEKERCP